MYFKLRPVTRILNREVHCTTISAQLEHQRHELVGSSGVILHLSVEILKKIKVVVDCISHILKSDMKS